MKILEPSGEVKWQTGQEAAIHWKLALDAGTDCRLELWRAGAKVADLGKGFSASGEDVTRFTVPKVPAAADYQIRAVSGWLERQGIPSPYAETGPFIGIDAR